MVCSNCGFANQPGVNFCTRCGTRLVLPTTPPAGAAPPSSPPPQYAPHQGPVGQYAPNQPPQQPYPPQQQYPPPQYPPGQYPYPVAQAPRQGRSPCGCCFAVFLVIIVLLVGTVGVGWYMLQNGTLTQRGILNTIGMGTGEIAVMNLTDGDLSVSITSLSENSDSSLLKTNLALKPTDSNSFTSIKPGRYRIDFSATVGGRVNGDCFMQIGSGDFYQFVAVNEGMVVSSEKNPPSTVEDLDMVTSSLCRQ